MPEENNLSKTTYFIEAENAAEMARLIHQDRIITRCMGGLFPPQFDLTGIHDILDIACGPGGWALDVARAYPDKRVTAIDISQIMVGFAQYQATQMQVPNAHFQTMNILQPLAFSDNAFDLINVRFISGFLLQTQWPPFLQECFRITRPGGLIRLTEPDRTISNSPSVEQLNDFLARAMHRAGQSSSPNELQFGVTPLLRSFLNRTGYVNVQKAAYVLESSASTEEHLSQYQNSMVFFKLLQPFFVKTGITTQEEAEVLYQRALEEMLEPDYCALWYFLSAWGEKPR